MSGPSEAQSSSRRSASDKQRRTANQRRAVRLRSAEVRRTSTEESGAPTPSEPHAPPPATRVLRVPQSARSAGVVPDMVGEAPVTSKPVDGPADWRPRIELREQSRRGVLAGWLQDARELEVGSIANAVGFLVIVGAVVLLLTHPSHHATQTTQVPSTHVFTPPVPLAPGAAYVRTRVLPSGQLLVRHWIRAGSPVSRVRLVVPDVSGLPAGAVSVHKVVIAGDQREVAAGRHGQAGREYTFPPARDLYVSYRLEGTLEHSGSVAGRALARITSLDVETGVRLTRSIRVIEGPRILSLACSAPTPGALPSPCGQQDGSGPWTVRLDPRTSRDRVMAQVDLG
jgi:hypothetical protein